MDATEGAASRVSLAPGDMVGGRYRAATLLARGGMGEVWSADDVVLERPVALKVLRGEIASDAAVARRFEAEARAAARLRSRHTVAVFDAGRDDHRLFLVMERLPGTNLADEIAAGPLGPKPVREMASDVLAALAAAHDVGLVHRDIKPSNILRDWIHGWKVADFGIAKSVDTHSSATTTGLVMGTPAYLAPERLLGAPASPASDLYSLGVVMYESLAGRRPFDAPDASSMIASVIGGRAARLRSLRPDLPDELVTVVETAMATDPAARYRDAATMLAALRQTPTLTLRRAPRAGGPVASPASLTATLVIDPPATTPIAVAPPTRPRRVRRQWSALAVGAAVVTVVIAALVAGLAHRPGATPSSPPPTRAATTSAPTTSPTGLPGPLTRDLQTLGQELRR